MIVDDFNRFIKDVRELTELIGLQHQAMVSGSTRLGEFLSHLNKEAEKLNKKYLEKPRKYNGALESTSEDLFYRPDKFKKSNTL